MKSGGSSEDAATLLYLVPFALSGIYGLYLWVSSGISFFLPSSVYLAVTRDPIVFAIASISVMLGLVVELSAVAPPERGAKLASLAGTLQAIAVASFVLTLFFAFYANGFTDVSGAATDFVLGRFGLVFPAMLVLLSYLITARFNVAGLRDRRSLGIVAMLLVPVSIYVLGKRSTGLGLAAAMVFVVIGLALFLLPARKQSKAQKP